MNRVILFGSGAMGSSFLFRCVQDISSFKEIIVCDISNDSLENAKKQIEQIIFHEIKVIWKIVDVSHKIALQEFVQKDDFIVSCLPWESNRNLIQSLAEIPVTILGVARPIYAEVQELHDYLLQKEITFIFGAGLEPGLTEIFGRYILESFDIPEELHLRCGGVPEVVSKPLGYKLVFGGKEMPFDIRPSYEFRNGKLIQVERFSNIEPEYFDNIGQLECWNDGLLPWFLELEICKKLSTLTQKTLRWPGYAEKVLMLKELGFLEQKPIQVNGVEVIPKKFVDSVLVPQCEFKKSDRDLVILRARGSGLLNGKIQFRKIDIIDKFDGKTGLTAMARVTGFTAYHLMKIIFNGLFLPKGAYSCEKIIFGASVKNLVKFLTDDGIMVIESFDII